MAPDKPRTPRIQRLFLALWPDEGVKEQLAEHANQWTWSSGCAPYAPADWHVTLHFIGDVDADRVEDISTSAGVPFQPFELILDQPRLWPHGLAVLCATEVPMPLLALYDRLGNVLRGLDLPVETRPYQPHATLARRAGAAIPPTASAPVVWWVRRFALVISTGDREQRYRVIRQYH
ncbi:MAG: RNA 2',3'-cyclic phosphodiesterase [Pseudomonadota bacterium]